MSRLLSAVFRNDLTKVTSLLEREPLLARDVEALCQGIGWGRKEVVMLLLQRGADPNAKDRNGNHPLKMACLSLAPELFGELVRHGSDPALADGLTSDAAACGRTDILRYLQQSGFNLNRPNLKGVLPIEAAVGMGHLAAVEYLLSVKIDVTAIDVSKPLKPWKGALPRAKVMEQIRERISARKAEPGAPPNGGPSRQPKVPVP
jgi:ankyrin repeat protein